MSASSKKKLRKEQNAAQLTEKQLSEQKEAKKLKTQTIVFVVAIALVLAIGLASVSYSAYKTSGIAERLTTALTIGEHKLSSAEMNYFYIDAINSTYQTWYSQYGNYTDAYLSMLFGLDVTKPLNEQVYDKENNKSYADYFLDMAIENAVSVYALCDLAAAENYHLSDSQNAFIENTIKNMENSGKAAGARSLTEYLKGYYGTGASEKSFRNYLTLINTANAMETEAYNSLSFTPEDLAAHSEENFDNYSSFSYSTFYLSTNDFIECTAKEDDKDHVHSEEEKNAAQKAAEEAANSIVSAKPANAEEFNAAIKELSVYTESATAACTENDALLYTSITNSDIAEWLADSSRKAGDVTVIANTSSTTDDDGNTTEVTNGYNVVLFQDREDNNMKLVNVRHILKSFTGSTTDDQGNTVYPEASIKAASDFIAEMQDLWLDGDATEESFAEIAKQNSTDSGSAANGGLYENVYPGQMVPTFNDWCFDEARQPGDYGVVETDYGIHLMYFVGHSDTSYRDLMVENTLRSEEHKAWYSSLFESAEYTVNNTSHLSLDLVLSRG